jgi:uncharacterized membrane protein
VTRGDRWLLSAALASLGLGLSSYLSWEWYASSSAPWCDLDAYFSCSAVRESAYSSLAGVPTAALGVGGFALLLTLSVLALRGFGALGPLRMEAWAAGVAAGGAVVGLALTSVEILLIQAVCILCLAAFALDLAILIVILPMALAPPS